MASAAGDQKKISVSFLAFLSMTNAALAAATTPRLERVTPSK